MTKNKILCFLDSDGGRDTEILMPLVSFAEQYLNAGVTFAFVWDLHAMYTEKPDLVLLPNTVGSRLNFQLSKYAHEQNIPVFALMSEGNIRTDGSFYYWGYNTDKVFYQDFVGCWSKRARDFLRGELPAISNRIVFTGATGFDRYKIFTFAQKQEFLSKHGYGKFKKVIGYAGWAFGKLSNAQGREEILHYFKGDDSKMPWISDQMLKVEAILKKLIESSPDTLFILKRHPNEANPSITVEGQNEMNRLTDHENVWYVNDRITNIHDLISVSDIWTSFESTTAMEAWMMGYKPTIFLNPDPDFNRDPTYKGTVVVQTAGEAQNLIEEFYTTGKLKAFDDEERKSARTQIFERTIGRADGLNHVRAGFYLNESLKKLRSENRQPAYRKKFRYLLMRFLMNTGRHFYNRELFLKLPRFKKTIWIFDHFSLTRVKQRKKEYDQALPEFYLKIFGKKPTREELFTKIKDDVSEFVSSDFYAKP